jgi:hypothetical protein
VIRKELCPSTIFVPPATLPHRSTNESGAEVRISLDAPFAYKTTNISVLGLFIGDGGLQDVLAADGPDGPVINLDRIDDRTDVALAG